MGHGAKRLARYVVCLCLCSPVSPPVCLPACLYVSLPVCLSVPLLAWLSDCPSIQMSFSLSACLSFFVFLSVCSSFCAFLFVCPYSVHLSNGHPSVFLFFCLSRVFSRSFQITTIYKLQFTQTKGIDEQIKMPS